MSVDNAAQDNSPYAGGITDVSLSYVRDGDVWDPLPLLRIPYDFIKLYTLKPRKWLLYVATNICGAEGMLRFQDAKEDITEREMEQGVNPGDRYVFCFCFVGEERFLDWFLRDHQRDTSTVSTRSRVVSRDLVNYYGGCPFTLIDSGACEVCHLVPHVKGDEYLIGLLAARGEPDVTMSVDDYQNQVMMNATLHRAFDKLRAVAFIKTPNKFLKTNEVPGGEQAIPDEYRVTVHCFSNSQISRRNFYHGASSDMKRGAGLEEPIQGARRSSRYQPKDVLLDITYAFTVLTRFGHARAKEMLEERSRKDYYPAGVVKRGEDRKGKKLEREERKRSIEEQDRARNERKAQRSKTNDDNGDRNEENNGEIDYFDFILRMTLMSNGIRLEELEAERERRRREMEEHRAQRFAEWRDTVNERHYHGDSRRQLSGLNNEYLVSDTGEDEPVRIDDALFGIPVSSSTPPPMTYSNTSSDDFMDLSHEDDDEQAVEVARQDPVSHLPATSKDGANIENAQKQMHRLTEDEDAMHLTCK